MFLLFGQFTLDSRLLANLVAVHVLVLFLLGVCVALRWLVTRGGNRLAGWTGSQRLKQFSAEATRHGHTMLFWLTVTAMALVGIGGIVYHTVGRDARADWKQWYGQLTAQHLLQFSFAVGGLAVLVIFASGLGR